MKRATGTGAPARQSAAWEVTPRLMVQHMQLSSRARFMCGQPSAIASLLGECCMPNVNENKHLVVALYDDLTRARQAQKSIGVWDKADESIRLGSTAVIYK